ncbi:MAG TPA: hypothetical protein VFU13_23795 [Steroidobacteraceae bacterium]|nr:hypothetical protein [Steroidobacteraceae bacterium]
MRTNKLDGMTRAATGAALLALLLAGCDKPAPENTPVPPSELPGQPAPATPETPPADVPAPDAAPAPPPADDAPPPTEPSVVPKPASSEEPAVDSMLAAIPSAKMSVAVDLRYSFDGPVLPDQPVNVHLAAVPRAGGAKLTVSVQEAPGIRVAASPLNVQKTSASGVYRQQFSLTKLAAETRQLSVLVIMEMGTSSGFGYFTIPLDTLASDAGTNPQKQESVKQR